MNLFLRKIDNMITYKDMGRFYAIDIIGFDEEKIDDRDFLLTLIKDMASDKNIYLGLFRTESNVIDRAAILEEAACQDRYKRIRIDPNKFKLNETMFQSGNVNFYICDQSLGWEEFLKIKLPEHYHLLKEKKLLVKIMLCDMEPVSMNITKNCDITVEYIVEQFKLRNYKVKKLFWFS